MADYIDLPMHNSASHISQRPERAGGELPTVCFFARVPEPALLEGMTFYAEDIAILKELGLQVRSATRLLDVPWTSNFYFVWWPGWGAFVVALAKILGRRSVLISNVHYQDPLHGYHRRSALERMMIRWAERNASVVLPVSTLEYEGAVALGARNAHLVHHSIRVPEEIRAFEERENLVLSIGHMNDKAAIARKRFDNVIRAIPYVLERVPAARFVFAGRVSADCPLQSLARALGVSDVVRFPGFISNAEKIRLLSSARVLAQPAAWEGFGVAQLEALAYGVPMVTSDRGAVREVVGECALFCDSESPEDIGRNITRLLLDPEQWRTLSWSGHKRASALFSREARKAKISHCLLHLGISHRIFAAH
jgi:glycosyltransferase involved in cell wall biosynthesis